MTKKATSQAANETAEKKADAEEVQNTTTTKDSLKETPEVEAEKTNETEEKAKEPTKEEITATQKAEEEAKAKETAKAEKAAAKEDDKQAKAIEKRRAESTAKIQETVNEIKTKFGDDAIMLLGDQPQVKVDAISTGSLGLDQALGIGGLPRGRIIEVFGPESSGKTTLSLHVIAEAQKKGGVCAFVDAEHALDPEYAKRIGVKTDQLLISQPNTGEQALEIVESLVRSQKLDVIVIDSVAALTPKDEIEGDMGAYHVGKQARLMSQALRKLTAIVAQSKTVVIFINQIRMQIGVMFGNPETTPGGKALKFYTSVRLDIRRIAQIKKGDEVMGGRVRVKVVKNKVAAPFRQTEFDLMYNEGISLEGEMLALGEKYDIIKKAGASYSYGEIKMARGYDNARQYLKDGENIKVRKEILKRIDDELTGNGKEEDIVVEKEKEKDVPGEK